MTDSTPATAATDELVAAVQARYDALHGEGVVKITYHPEDNATVADYPAGEPGVFDLGSRHYVAPMGEAGYRWWHDCPAVEHVSWGWFGRVSSDQVSGHRVVHHVPSLTVEGSLLCTDCGDHGFIRDTKWVPA